MQRAPLPRAAFFAAWGGKCLFLLNLRIYNDAARGSFDAARCTGEGMHRSNINHLQN
jgi:hypothetical protein